MKRFINAFLAAAAALAAGCASDGETDDSQIIGINHASEPKISYCLPRYLSDAETRTIYEVFTGEELPYGHLILRSNPAKRAGMYFFVMFGFEPDSVSLACKFVLEVDSNKRPAPRKFVFDVPETHSVFREVKLGITGSDWDPDEKVNAWKLTLLSPSGKVITSAQSWLWEVGAGESKISPKK